MRESCSRGADARTLGAQGEERVAYEKKRAVRKALEGALGRRQQRSRRP